MHMYFHVHVHVRVYIRTCHFSPQDGFSPLAVSAQVGDLSTAELLLREGAQVDFGNNVSLYVSNDLHSYMYTCMYVLVHNQNSYSSDQYSLC